MRNIKIQLFTLFLSTQSFCPFRLGQHNIPVGCGKENKWAKRLTEKLIKKRRFSSLLIAEAFVKWNRLHFFRGGGTGDTEKALG